MDLDELTPDPELTSADPGFVAWQQRGTWFRAAHGWSIHVVIVHVAAQWALSKLGAQARSPSEAAVRGAADQGLQLRFAAGAEEHLLARGEPRADPPVNTSVSI